MLQVDPSIPKAAAGAATQPLVPDPMVVVIRTQVDYYLSPSNLEKDRFLADSMNEHMMAPLHLLCGFRKLHAICSDPDVILAALAESPSVLLEADANGVWWVGPFAQARRSARCTIILRDVDPAATREQIQSLLPLPLLHYHVPEERTRYLSFVDERACKKVLFELQGKSLNGKAVQALVKTDGGVSSRHEAHRSPSFGAETPHLSPALSPSIYSGQPLIDVRPRKPRTSRHPQQPPSMRLPVSQSQFQREGLLAQQRRNAPDDVICIQTHNPYATNLPSAAPRSYGKDGRPLPPPPLLGDEDDVCFRTSDVSSSADTPEKTTSDPSEPRRDTASCDTPLTASAQTPKMSFLEAACKAQPKGVAQAAPQHTTQTTRGARHTHPVRSPAMR